MINNISELLEKKIEYNNKSIGFIKSNLLINNEIELPNFQRIKDNDKINDIINYQIDYFKKNKIFNFLGLLSIHYCNTTKLYYLIDGQHRYNSIKELFNNYGHIIDIFIELIIVDNYNELKHNYDLINTNTPLPEFPESIDKNIPETVALYFKEKYPSIWSKNSRARRPHIYFNFFQEALGVLTEKLNIKNYEQLKTIIEDYNTKLSKLDIKQFPDSNNLNDTMIEKCNTNKLYLGLYKHVDDDYRYKWVSKIIENESGEKPIKKKTLRTKKKIPQKIKNDSWDKYIGKHIGESPCLCCKTTTIDSKNFIAGHVISEKNGGQINIDNIRPICNGCNSSMGTENMDIFIEKYFNKY